MVELVVQQVVVLQAPAATPVPTAPRSLVVSVATV